MSDNDPKEWTETEIRDLANDQIAGFQEEGDMEKAVGKIISATTFVWDEIDEWIDAENCQKILHKMDASDIVDLIRDQINEMIREKIDEKFTELYHMMAQAQPVEARV